MNETAADRDPIYLDHNATTPILPAVLEAMQPYLTHHFGNPSSGHVYGQRAHAAVEQARAQVAALLGCQPDEVIFTSGGTESNNLAIQGVAIARPRSRHLALSSVEHPAVVQPCQQLVEIGWRASRISVDGGGRLRLAELDDALRGDTALVSVMHANNETGTLQPIAELAERVHARGGLVHTDAAQSVGKLPVRVDELAVDLLSVAGHKLYAPKGVGALYVRRRTPLLPFARGAGHERGLRPGTENVASIVGLGVACSIANATLQTESVRVAELRDELWRRLSGAIPGLTSSGDTRARLPNTLNVRFPHARGSAVLAGAPEVAASTGSACHDGGEQPSAVLLALGLAPDDALGAVRLSLGRSTTALQVADAAAALVRSYRALVGVR